MKYTFRAECETDLSTFTKAVHRKIKSATFTREFPFPDVDVEMDIDMNKKDVLAAMKRVDDGHRMIETLEEVL